LGLVAHVTVKGCTAQAHFVSDVEKGRARETLLREQLGSCVQDRLDHEVTAGRSPIFVRCPQFGRRHPTSSRIGTVHGGPVVYEFYCFNFTIFEMYVFRKRRNTVRVITAISCSVTIFSPGVCEFVPFRRLCRRSWPCRRATALGALA